MILLDGKKLAELHRNGTDLDSPYRDIAYEINEYGKLRIFWLDFIAEKKGILIRTRGTNATSARWHAVDRDNNPLYPESGDADISGSISDAIEWALTQPDR